MVTRKTAKKAAKKAAGKSSSGAGKKTAANKAAVFASGFDQVMKQIGKVERDLATLKKMFVRRVKASDFLEGSPKGVLLRR